MQGWCDKCEAQRSAFRVEYVEGSGGVFRSDRWVQCLCEACTETKVNLYHAAMIRELVVRSI